jgi:lipoprotein-releasing system ATP-binding protein
MDACEPPEGVNRSIYFWAFVVGPIFSSLVSWLAPLVVTILWFEQLPVWARWTIWVVGLTTGVLVHLCLVTLFAVLLHKAWRSIQRYGARTTPGEAVAFLFVPVLNMYWVFQAIWGLFKDMNNAFEQRQVRQRWVYQAPEGLALSLCVLLLVNIGLGMLLVVLPAVGASWLPVARWALLVCLPLTSCIQWVLTFTFAWETATAVNALSAGIAAGEISARKLQKSYSLGRTTLRVLRGLDLDIAEGEFVCILGASGSGKSTLLHLMGLLDRADSGTILLNGADAEELSQGRRNEIRCKDVGFVFQFYHLLPELNVLENVLLPAKIYSSALGWFSRRAQARDRAKELLKRLGLGDRLKHRPKELSGGERQRVAIARALMNQPKYLLADEPTGNLDSKTGKRIMKVLRRVSREIDQTVVMVTHDADLAGQADRVVRLVDGKLIT